MQVHQMFSDIPAEVFVATGLGAWRRGVVSFAQEPGAPMCKAYLETARRVVAAAESIRAEQSRAAGDLSASAGASAA